MTQVVRSEFILGGQKSGKSRRAEALAQSWLASGPPHTAILIATAQAFDDELRARIERHQQTWHTNATALCAAIAQAPGPIVLVSNEIGLGVIPLGKEVRDFVDALGLLNQMVAATCERVTLMTAGIPLTIKGAT